MFKVGLESREGGSFYLLRWGLRGRSMGIRGVFGVVGYMVKVCSRGACWGYRFGMEGGFVWWRLRCLNGSWWGRCIGIFLFGRFSVFYL